MEVYIARILIVEDNHQEAYYLKDILLDIGYKIVGIAASGENALEICKSQPVDITIMDIQLSGKLNGIRTAEIIKKEYGSHIIYLTSLKDQKTFKKAKASFPDFFLSKPFNKYQLIDVIDHVFEKPKIENYSDNFFFLKSKNGVYEKHSVDQISYIMADNSYSHIYFNFDQPKKTTISKGLKVLLTQLNNVKIQRINRSYAINMDCIELIDNWSVKLHKNQELLNISKAYQEKFENLVKKL